MGVYMESYDEPCLIINEGVLQLLVGDNTWLSVRVSEIRLGQIRAGSVDLHDAFAKAESGFCTLQKEGETASNIPCYMLEERILPTPGTLLFQKSML